jgi:hypothetical protein
MVAGVNTLASILIPSKDVLHDPGVTDYEGDCRWSAAPPKLHGGGW